MKGKVTAQVAAMSFALGAGTSLAADLSEKDRLALHQAYAMFAVRVLEEEQGVVGMAEHCVAKGVGGASLQAAYTDWRKRNHALYGRAHAVLSTVFYDKILGPSVSTPQGKGMREVVVTLVPFYQKKAKDFAAQTDPGTLATTCVELEKRLVSGELDYRRQKPGAFAIVERMDIDNPLRYSQDQLLGLAR